MVFVPPPAPSRRAQRLADALSDVIEDFRRQNPSTNDTDIRSALRMVATGDGAARKSAVLVAVGVLALMAGLLMFLFVQRADGAANQEMQSWVTMAPLILIGLMVIIAVAVKGSRGP